MSFPVQALTDAATIYAAARFIADAYDGSSPQGIQYRSRMYDEALYYEFLNNIALYDGIVYDDSSLESATADEIKPLFAAVNDACEDNVLAIERLQVHSSDDLWFIQQGLCRLILEIVESDPGKRDFLANVQVPWAYRTTEHVEYYNFDRILEGSGVKELIPFAIFVWRGICYSAVAESRHRNLGQPFAYVAAPGRIRALQAILSSDEVRGLRYPREAWAALATQMPNLPSRGFDFRKVSSISPTFTSELTTALRKIPKDQHLAFIARYRNLSSSRRTRELWGKLLFERRDVCTVGNQIIQILQGVEVGGDLHQTILATAAE